MLNWVLNANLKEVLIQLDIFEEYQICYVFQEGNKVADKLANMGADGESTIPKDFFKPHGLLSNRLQGKKKSIRY